MKKRILIVDDDRAVRESLKKVLENAGYEILFAVDGYEAESKSSYEVFDLLVLDLDLPKQNGWDVFRLVSSQRPLLPVVIITGLREHIDPALIPAVGALIEKPVEVPALLETIKGLLAETFEKRLRRLGASLQHHNAENWRDHDAIFEKPLHFRGHLRAYPPGREKP